MGLLDRNRLAGGLLLGRESVVQFFPKFTSRVLRDIEQLHRSRAASASFHTRLSRTVGACWGRRRIATGTTANDRQKKWKQEYQGTLPHESHSNRNIIITKWVIVMSKKEKARCHLRKLIQARKPLPAAQLQQQTQRTASPRPLTERCSYEYPASRGETGRRLPENRLLESTFADDIGFFQENVGLTSFTPIPETILAWNGSRAPEHPQHWVAMGFLFLSGR